MPRLRQVSRWILRSAPVLCLVMTTTYLAVTVWLVDSTTKTARSGHDSWIGGPMYDPRRESGARAMLQAKLHRHLHDNQNDSKNDPLPLPPHTPGLFIHLGKTGGSSLAQLLRHGCHSWIHKPCRSVTNESIVSRLSTYLHTPDLERLDKNQGLFRVSRDSILVKNISASSYLFTVMTVRDPLARLRSAFVFEHPANQLAVPVMRQRFAKVFACFPTLQSFANALGDEDSAEFESGTNMSTACRNQARAIMNHGVRESMHFYYDYRLVSRLLLGYDEAYKPTRSSTTLLVIRTETLRSDWQQANAWLGDTSQLPSNADLLAERVHDTAKKQLVVDNSLDDAGRRKLCRALVDEYGVYLTLIRQAANLSARQKSETLQQARAACPG